MAASPPPSPSGGRNCRSRQLDFQKPPRQGYPWQSLDFLSGESDAEDCGQRPVEPKFPVSPAPVQIVPPPFKAFKISNALVKTCYLRLDKEILPSRSRTPLITFFPLHPLAGKYFFEAHFKRTITYSNRPGGNALLSAFQTMKRGWRKAGFPRKRCKRHLAATLPQIIPKMLLQDFHDNQFLPTDPFLMRNIFRPCA